MNVELLGFIQTNFVQKNIKNNNIINFNNIHLSILNENIDDNNWLEVYKIWNKIDDEVG